MTISSIKSVVYPAIYFIGDHALVVAWILFISGAVFCLLVAWINRPRRAR